MTPMGWVATAIFVMVYAIIVTDRVDKTKLALTGAVLMIMVGVIDQHTAFHGSDGVEGIDWNTIFLLIGMMIIVNITRRTGLFEWVAIKAAKLAHGEPTLILVGMVLSTAVLSALLDNVTTVLLIVPAVIVIYEALELDPVPPLIFVIMASNIGGTATLVGHPPNIIIGSATGFTFMDYLRVNGPIVLLILALLCGIIWWWLRGSRAGEAQRLRIMQMDESQAITDRPLLNRCLLTLALVFTAFMIHGEIGLEPATIALAGAALLLMLDTHGVREPLREIEWPTIFFFIGLFIMVAGLVETGVIEAVGMAMVRGTGGNLMALMVLVLWGSAIAAALMDNIPFVATMAALLRVVAPELHPAPETAGSLHEILTHESIQPIWWALSLGAGMGGNLALIGASPNLVAAGVAARSGHPISFMRFLRYGVPITVPCLLLCTLYLWLRFYQ